MAFYHVVKRKKTIRIYINELLHLCIKRDCLIGIHSWIDISPCGPNFGTGERYVIEFTTTAAPIKCEYDNRQKWMEILRLLDKHL